MNGVCQNQDEFNNAFYNAVKYARDKDEKKVSKSGTYIALTVVYVVLYLSFLIWAIVLAMKQDPSVRTVHLVLAIVFAPAYVIAYYLNMM